MNKKQFRYRVISSLVGAFVFATVTSGASRIIANEFGQEQVLPLTIILWLSMILIVALGVVVAKQLQRRLPNTAATATQEREGDNVEHNQQ